MRRESDTFVSDFKSQVWTLMWCLNLMIWSFEITVEFDNTTQQSNLCTLFLQWKLDRYSLDRNSFGTVFCLRGGLATNRILVQHWSAAALRQDTYSYYSLLCTTSKLDSILSSSGQRVIAKSIGFVIGPPTSIFSKFFCGKTCSNDP